jgi:hypothetical protein
MAVNARRLFCLLKRRSFGRTISEVIIEVARFIRGRKALPDRSVLVLLLDHA